MKRKSVFMSQVVMRTIVLIMAMASLSAVEARNKKKKVRIVQPVAVVVPSLNENDSKRFNYFFLEAVRQQQLDHHAAAYDLLRHCLEINPQSPEANFALSAYYAEMQNDSAMLACMEKAAAISPSNHIYLERLGQVYIKTKDYDKATEIYERLSENNPGRTDVLGILVQLYQNQQNYDKVIDILNRFEMIEGSNEDITLSKMQVYAMQGDKKKEFNELRNLARQHPNDYNFRVMMGNWLLQNGKEKQALAEYNNVLKKEPGNIMAQMSMLDYYRSQQQDSLAKAQTERLLLSEQTELDSKRLLMRQFISDNEQHGGDSTEVLDLFEKVLSQPQPNAEMADLCAAYMSIKKMPQDTISKALERVISIEPDNVGARLQLLQTAWEKKDFDRIVTLAKPGVEYHPDNIWFYYFLGLAYSQKKDNELALETFRKGVGQAGEDSDKKIVADFYSIIGDILHEKGQFKEAYEAYDSCLQYQPDNIGCLNNYAYYLSVEGRDLAKAEQMSYRTVKVESNNPTYLDTYAWILFRQERYEEARIYIEQALAADSTLSDVIIEHAGDIYMMAGMPEKALEYWQRALDMGSDNAALLKEKIRKRKYIDDRK
jgi:tetratricopeptide (TPR) repeat protein